MEKLSNRILFEDNHLIIVNKLPSEIVQGDKTGDVPLSEEVKEYIKKKYNKPGAVFLGVTHRLDRPVSGVITFARTSKALARMNKIIQERKFEKTYWAVVKERPPDIEGKLVNWMKKNEKQNKSYCHDREVKDSKKAELNYRFITSSKDFHLVEVELLTGRHHQIRAQLAHIGCPIKGDLKYGFPRSNKDASIHLHARSIAFMHPVQQTPVKIIAKPPDEPLWNYFLEIV